MIHFATKSHVDQSILNPTIFAETNVIGTLNLLEIAKNHRLEQPFVYRGKCKY